MTRAFLDTNVVVYAFDAGMPAKRDRAREFLAEGASAPVLSTQVLLETANVLRRGLAETWPWPAVREIVAELAELEVVVTDASLVQAGLAEAERWQFSHWDGMIVAAARQARVDVLYTEDLSHGQDLDGLAVVNPFL